MSNNCLVALCNRLADPLGVLEEGEVFFRPHASSMCLAGHDGVPMAENVLRGAVLVSSVFVEGVKKVDAFVEVMRHPCKLPTDVRKVCLLF